MDSTQLDEHLGRDFALLRAAVAGADRAAPVPGCPEWTVDDLAHHVAEVYLHKTECIRLGAFPDPWPPEDLNPDPVAVLDETYAALRGQFAAHCPADPAATWHDPDQSVGFWIRRMAQETVIHRVDGERAAGIEVSPIPRDLALDGIDELLKLFLAYNATKWAADEEIAALLKAADPRPVLVRATTGEAWLLTASAEGLTAVDAEVDPDADAHAGTGPGVGAGAEGAEAALTVSGEPDELLRWLWNRAETDHGVAIDGDPVLLAQLEAFKTALTQ